jgi:hypothetical protein
MVVGTLVAPGLWRITLPNSKLFYLALCPLFHCMLYDKDQARTSTPDQAENPKPYRIPGKFDL